MCVCIALCTIVEHNIAQNRPDSFPSYSLPRRLCVTWEPSLPPLTKKGGGAPSPIFGPFVLRSHVWTHQDATWYGGRPHPRGLCLRWRPSPPPQKGGRALLPNFRPTSIVAKRLDGSRWHHGTWHGGILGPGHIVLDRDAAPLPQKGAEPPPILGPFLLWPNDWMHQDATWYGGRLSPDDFVLDGEPCPPSPTRGRSPQIFGHVYCGQTAAWTKMPLGTEVGVGLRDIVLDGDPAPLP